MVKNLPEMQETWVRPMGQEDCLEKGMGTHSSIFAWRIPRTEETSKLYSPQGRKEFDTTEQQTLSDFKKETTILLTKWIILTHKE